jgi:hypothetical protein
LNDSAGEGVGDASIVSQYARLVQSPFLKKTGKLPAVTACRDGNIYGAADYKPPLLP